MASSSSVSCSLIQLHLDGTLTPVVPHLDIVVFGKLICPGYDNVWNSQQVSYHQGTNDYWVSVRGQVYDLTNYYKLQFVAVFIRSSFARIVVADIRL